jgi:hypothetical protein
MLNFDERDLFDFAQKSGFDALQVDFQIKQERKKISDWESQLRRRPNPRAPSLEEVMEQALTSEEREQFVRHLQPLVESRQGKNKSGVAYLSATK